MQVRFLNKRNFICCSSKIILAFAFPFLLFSFLSASSAYATEYYLSLATDGAVNIDIPQDDAAVVSSNINIITTY